MVLTIKVDVKSAVLYGAFLLVAAGALWIAFPWAHQWFPAGSSELASWVQAIGSLMALVIAILVPRLERRANKCEDQKKAEDDSDITIRFHSAVFETNEQVLRVARAHLPGGSHALSANAELQVTGSISALRTVSFDQIRIIAAHDPELAKHLADFHCEVEFLNGIIARNKAENFPFLTDSIKSRIYALINLSYLIKRKTVPGLAKHAQ